MKKVVCIRGVILRSFPRSLIDYVKALQQRLLCGKAKRKNICKRNYCSMQYYTGRDDHKKYPAFADISEVGEMNRDNVAISGDWEARINLATTHSFVTSASPSCSSLRSSCFDIYPEIWRLFKIGLPFFI
jgi:hypothetical protein